MVDRFQHLNADGDKAITPEEIVSPDDKIERKQRKVKVRNGIDADDYSEPGWYENPPGTEPYEWTGELPKFSASHSPKTLLPPCSGLKQKN